MTPFLKLVVDDIKSKTGGNLAHSVVVFPNRRAGLFMDEYLTADVPCWAPRYMTISELFRSLSSLKPADPIDTNFRICHIYHALSKDDVVTDAEKEIMQRREEAPENFYGWAERLSADFDDIDKSMVAPGELLQNVSAYHQIDLGREVEDKVRDQIRQFFGQMADKEKDTLIKDRFRRLWNHLPALYTALNESLAEDGLAYEGALYRHVVTDLESGKLSLPADIDTFYIVGFNVLDVVEQRLFKWLQAAGKAKFYWDYDLFYTASAVNNEAGTFIRENLQMFGSELDARQFDVMKGGKQIEIIAAPTENAQAYFTGEWLKDNLTDDPRATAVVLCNEELLEPMLHALPDAVNHVNITKGFPLSHTTAYTFVNKYFSNPATQQCADVVQILTDLAQKVDAEGCKNNAACQEAQADIRQADTTTTTEYLTLLQIYNEAFFQTHTIVNRFLLLAEKPYFTVSSQTLSRLLLQVMRQTSIPFHGEPVEGLQVMGVLETRCLDFTHILMLSTNEGMMPRPMASNSFIPYPLRAAFGLSDVSRQTAVFAYYFYRLIQRAEKITFLYNNTADGLQSGEMSRFLLQLKLQKNFEIRHSVLSMPQKVFHFGKQAAKKPDNLYDILNPFAKDKPQTDANRIPLSPSSLNKYIDCPLSFYFHRVLKLKKPDEDKGEISSRLFGLLFHDAAEMFYKDAKERGITNFKEYNARFIKKEGHDALRGYIRRAFAKQEGISEDVVIRETLLEYMLNLLRYDATYDYLEIDDLEQDACLTLPVSIGGRVCPFRVGGRIDRIDICTPPKHLQQADRPDDNVKTLRIVDYKTGAKEQYGDCVSDIFDNEKGNRPYYFFQTYLYCLTQQARADQLHLPQSAALFYPHKSTIENYDPWIGLPCPKPKSANKPLPKTHVLTKDLLNEFRERLQALLEEIFDTSKDFVPTRDEEKCTYCNFRALCGLPETS